jgi:tRNA C32,U32 (ribose-2'-O)-methylase TrmJ
VLLIVHQLFLASSALNDGTTNSSGPGEEPPAPLANAAEVESVHDQVVKAMRMIGFRPYNDDPSNFSRVLKRFLTRTPLERRDAMVIHRICGQIRKFAAQRGGGKDPP